MATRCNQAFDDDALAKLLSRIFDDMESKGLIAAYEVDYCRSHLAAAGQQWSLDISTRMIDNRRTCTADLIKPDHVSCLRKERTMATRSLSSGTTIDEIADRIYCISTPVEIPGGGGFSFNQYLIDDDEPLLFHTGLRRLFPVVGEAVERT